jgi:hypothetical protein
MSDQKVKFIPRDFNRPQASLGWPKAIAICASLGGLYGAATGSAVGAVPVGAEVIGIAASAMAVMCGMFGMRFSLLFKIGVQARFNRYSSVAIGSLFGAILGCYLATMVLLALGAILGALFGWFLAFPSRGLLGGFMGVFLGTFIGAIAWAARLNQPAALSGAAWGFVIGALVALLLFLVFLRTVRQLFGPRQSGMGNAIDTKFE